MDILAKANFFHGSGKKDPAFSARDRITRAPKSLGFVILSPSIDLTPAGHQLLTSPRKDEVFLRQLLKFQIPSPYHKPSPEAASFRVKPYLELLRLIRVMGSLKFDELQIFGMQLTDWHDFDKIVAKINQFRTDKALFKGNYRKFKMECLYNEIRHIYSEKITRKDTRTRGCKNKSEDKFISTQAQNMRDYADACFRYLRATKLVNVSHIGKSLSIVPERMEDVDYILETIDRTPAKFDNTQQFVDFLGNPTLPRLLTDNRDRLLTQLRVEFPTEKFDTNATITQLKDLIHALTEQRKANALAQQIVNIKNREQFEDINNTFNQISHKQLYDAPLMLEWNTWRAMTMIDGGEITANFHFDDFGKPLSTAQGNMADIVCDYGDFMLTIEVTMQSGQKQFDAEGESIARHLGQLKAKCGKTCYCLFISPSINKSCIAFCYLLHHLNVEHYGGKSVLVPLPLTIFQKMLEDSYNADYVPNPAQIRAIFEQSKRLAQSAGSEKDWYDGILETASNWLNHKEIL